MTSVPPGPEDSSRSARETGGKNRLARATSPYLRQHQDNPVDWYEWSEEALARARDEDRPILLSVGYSACHWCHVMAHESFEDPEIAALMNARYINIKVDREERPDIDAIYQKVLQLMGEGGGWPLTVFLTPAQEPFYGGTYFPPRPSYGRPAFRQVLTALHELYASQRGEVQEQAGKFMRGLARMREGVDEAAAAPPDVALTRPEGLAAGVARLLPHVDWDWGGLGRAPKFPSATTLELFLNMSRRAGQFAGGDPPARAAAMLRLTLEKMWRGGVYDHLRGGFARYSVDRYWRVPHFEKMLYDNAQLLPLYAEASALWQDDAWLWPVARDTLEYLRVEMRDPGGAFYAATDADSEGEEGKYFAWTPAQIAEVLQDDELTRLAVHAYGVTRAGSFEHGRSVLQRERELDVCAQRLGVTRARLEEGLERARARLLEHRYTRVPPGRDDKLLTAWNGLLISGLARVAGVCERRGDDDTRARALELARAAAEFLLARHVQPSGRVLRASFEGRAHTRGYIDDVSALARGLLELYEQTLEARWRAAARALAEHALARYARDGGGWFLTADDAEALIERTEAHSDAATPSGVGVMSELLLRLDAHGVAPAGARAHTEATLRRFAAAPTSPSAHASVLLAARWAWPAAAHVTLRGRAPADVLELARVVRSLRLEAPAPVGLSFTAHDGPPDALVCRGPVCATPMTSARELRAALLEGPDGARGVGDARA